MKVRYLVAALLSCRLVLCADPMTPTVRDQKLGVRGGVQAARAGRTCGIRTAEIAFGLVAVAVITTAALLITNSSHSH